jgi:hypothetical protein
METLMQLLGAMTVFVYHCFDRIVINGYPSMLSRPEDGIRDFPAHLSLADQGRFAVGYYHQRQAFFVK